MTHLLRRAGTSHAPDLTSGGRVAALRTFIPSHAGAHMALDLLSRHCRILPQGTAPLKAGALDDYRAALSDRWEVINEHHLVGTFTFDDFAGALDFTNRVGEVAEAEDHHPEITLTWGKASVKIWTHSIDGLSENDFILAAKTDHLL